jgi:signal transduction histidine kinase
MHTAVLDDLGLVASLKDLCSQFSERYPDISWSFENSGSPASIPHESGDLFLSGRTGESTE